MQRIELDSITLREAAQLGAPVEVYDPTTGQAFYLITSEQYQKLRETLAEDIHPRDGNFRCHLAIIPDDDGTFSALALNLPGAGSCGDTEHEAIENAREAIAGVLESYIEDREAIPWAADYEIPAGAKTMWILV